MYVKISHQQCEHKTKMFVLLFSRICNNWGLTQYQTNFHTHTQIIIYTKAVSQQCTSPSLNRKGSWSWGPDHLVLLCFTMQLRDLFLCLDIKEQLLIIFAGLLMVYFHFRKDKDPPGFPPGPPALPILGNIFNIDAKQPHIYLTKVSWYHCGIYTCLKSPLGQPQDFHWHWRSLVKLFIWSRITAWIV